MTTPNTSGAGYPANWHNGGDFNPGDHMISLKGRDYLNVQARMQWFVNDQRALIMAGLASTSFVVRTELVEQDRERAYAHFKTYVRDVLGNEATMYGSETGKDFADYAEKASTKSLGRALLALGYGTDAAAELDEGERVVDSPQPHRQARPAPAPAPSRQAQPAPTQPQPRPAQQRTEAPTDTALDHQALATADDRAELFAAAKAASGATPRDIVIAVPRLCNKPLDKLTRGDVLRLLASLERDPRLFAIPA